MSSREFAYWCAFDLMGEIGPERHDVLSAKICQTIMTAVLICMGALPITEDLPVHMKDFLPNFDLFAARDRLKEEQEAEKREPDEDPDYDEDEVNASIERFKLYTMQMGGTVQSA